MALLVALLTCILQHSFILHTVTAEQQFRDGAMRLVGGSYQWEGRVEVFYDGYWGTITDSEWTSEDAQAVCRMMGYFRPGAVGFTGAYFGRGSGPIHLDHIVCSGTEYNLTDCETGTGTRQSSHSEDIGVKCNTIDENYRNGDVRLVGGPYNWEGTVEIFWNGSWGTISDRTWSTYGSQVVCLQLGFLSVGEPFCCPGQIEEGSAMSQTPVVSCYGTESHISECYIVWSSSNNREQDVGVSCERGGDNKHGDVRLVGGSYNWEGRVDIYLKGEWGTISYGGTDAIDAFVVCRQLGYDVRYGFSDTSYTWSPFVQGSGAIHLNYIHCTGSEYKLVDCSSNRNTWSHFADWSITCNNDVPNEGDVKLFYNSRNTDYYKGMIHVWLNGKWGTASDEPWTTENTEIICRQLGRKVGDPLYSRYYNYLGDIPIIMSNVTCLGNEAKLTDCSHSSGGIGDVASVECSFDASCSYGDTRLTGGHTEYEGRVEMCSSRGIWGSVCDQQWTQAESKVVCHSLGFDNEEGSYSVFRGFDTEPKIPFTVDYMKCQGSENSLKDCVHFKHSYGCVDEESIGVRCQPAQCEDGQVKLIGTHDIYEEGIVLVCSNKRWGTVCNSMTQPNYDTVCSQLGYVNGYRRYTDNLVTTMPVHITSLNCKEDENRVSDCRYKPGNLSTPACSTYLSVWCSPAYCADGQVRLVDGESEEEGRAEVCFSRRWGTITGDGWTHTESTVICNDLGYQPSSTDKDYAVRPATNSMPVYIKNVKCSGKELSLLECGFRGNISENDHFNDVAVRCKKPECADGDLKLLGGETEYDGVLQVCFDQRWGTINGDGWSAIDTHIACRQMGFNSSGEHFKETITKLLSTPIHMDNVACHGTEERLTDCSYHTDTSEDRHWADIWIECNTDSKVDETKSDGNTPAPLERESGKSQGGLGVGIVALLISILLVVVVVGYILATKQRRIRRVIRVSFHKSGEDSGEAKIITDPEPPKSKEEYPVYASITPSASTVIPSTESYQPLEAGSLAKK